jgi:hypothetical protein
MVDELEVLEGFAVGRSMYFWAVDGRGWLVVNIHEFGEHWKGSIVEKEGWCSGWIAWWVVSVEGHAAGRRGAWEQAYGCH